MCVRMRTTLLAQPHLGRSSPTINDMNRDDVNEGWVATREAARRLFVSEETLRRWDRQGRVPAEAVMRSGRSHRLWCQAWIDTQGAKRPERSVQAANDSTVALRLLFMALMLVALCVSVASSTALLFILSGQFPSIARGASEATRLRLVGVALIALMPSLMALMQGLVYLARLGGTWSMAALARPSLLRSAALCIWLGMSNLLPCLFGVRMQALDVDHLAVYGAMWAAGLLLMLPCYLFMYVTLRRIDAVAPMKDWDLSGLFEQCSALLMTRRSGDHHDEADDLWLLRAIRNHWRRAEQLEAKLEGRSTAS